MNARDIAIRTILGEAAGESPLGQAAVAHVLLNRAADPRWPSTLSEVALQPKQFSAWNKGAGGNHLVNKYSPGDAAYERVGAVYDAVISGSIADPTGGATHYYSPAGMQALVDQGAQSNLLPRWLQQENQRRGADPTTIGGHIFTGAAQGTPTLPQPTVPIVAEEDEPTLPGILAMAGQSMMQASAAPTPPPLMAPQAQGYTPTSRDVSYSNLFQKLGL